MSNHFWKGSDSVFSPDFLVSNAYPIKYLRQDLLFSQGVAYDVEVVEEQTAFDLCREVIFFLRVKSHVILPTTIGVVAYVIS